MADTPPELPAGNQVRPEPKPADEDRRMLDIRSARVQAMIARGETPHGHRINDDGTGFVPLGNPAWPVRPLDPHCTTYGEPSIELAVLVRKLLPNFDPDRDRRGWLEVAELVRRSGRPAVEVQAMGHDELVAFFRREVFGRPRPLTEVGQKPNVAAKPEPTAATITPGAVAEENTTPEKTTSEVLLEWLGDPIRKLKLVATLSSDRAGELIGRSGSSVREAGDAWDELKAEFKAYRALRRYERKRRRE